mgnify:CR=1 FL=1
MEKFIHICWLLQKPTVNASLLQSTSCSESESQSIGEQLMLQSNNLAISLGIDNKCITAVDFCKQKPRHPPMSLNNDNS